MKKAAYQESKPRSLRSQKLAEEQAKKEAAIGIKRTGTRVSEGESFVSETSESDAVKVEEAPAEEVVEEETEESYQEDE